MGKTIAFLLFLTAVTGVSVAKDFRNETVKCAFEQMEQCYSPIISLGANFTTKYAENKTELNETCKAGSSGAIACIFGVTSKCNLNPSANNTIVKGIGDLITKLCTNNSVDQNNFLNSSICYNKFIRRRENCLKKYSYGFKTDAKSLCCSNLKMVKCLQSDMVVCSDRDQDFQNNVTKTYRSLQNYVCQSYNPLCNGASAPWMGALTVLVAVLFSLSRYARSD